MLIGGSSFTVKQIMLLVGKDDRKFLTSGIVNTFIEMIDRVVLINGISNNNIEFLGHDVIN